MQATQDDKRLTLGVHAGDLDLRNDARWLLRLISASCRVVLYANADCRFDDLEDVVEIRLIRTNHGIRYRLWRTLYRLFGPVPSRMDYYSNAMRRLQKLKGWARFRAGVIAKVRFAVPRIFSIEWYLKRISSFDTTPIDGVDRFLFLTHIENLMFFARAVNSEIPTVLYLSSWDHVCKDTCYPKTGVDYLVWNQGCREDLQRYHGVEGERIDVVGSTQLVFVESYLKSQISAASERISKQVYYVCGHGYPGYVEQELELVRRLHQAIQEVDREITLCLRPYPNQRSWQIYQQLAQDLGLRLDDNFQQQERSRSQTFDEIYSKYDMVQQSIAVFHCGTTLGLEAAFLKAPVFLVVPWDWDLGVKPRSLRHISNVFKLQHLQRYLVHPEYPNVITKEDELIAAIEKALCEDSSILDYNERCAQEFPLRSIETIAGLIDRKLHCDNMGCDALGSQ